MAQVEESLPPWIENRRWDIGVQWMVNAGNAPDPRVCLPTAFCRFYRNVLPKKGYLLSLVSCAAAGESRYIPIEGANGQGCFYFGEGWRSFAMKIKAKLGCILLFKYVGILDFEVTVFDKGTTNCHGSVSYEECEHVEGVQQVPALYPYNEEDTVDPTVMEARPFIIKMSRTTRRQIVIPRLFEKNAAIKEKRTVIMHLLVSRRLCWPMTIVKNHGKNCKFGSYWPEVYEALGCEEGDSCKFYVNTELSTKGCLFVTVEKVNSVDDIPDTNGSSAGMLVKLEAKDAGGQIET